MNIKVIYIVVDILAIISILFTIRSINKINESYAVSLKKAMIYSIVAIIGNILIALSYDPFSAEAAYCIYFVAIDWIVVFLSGFSLSYTEHEEAKKKLKVPAGFIMGLDSVAILLNPFFRHEFVIYETNLDGTVFYQTALKPLYYVHLAIDYLAVLVVLFFIIYRIKKSHSIYRLQYIMILSVRLFVVLLNII